MRPIWLTLGTLGVIGSCRVYDEGDLVGPDTTIFENTGGRAASGGVSSRGGRTATTQGGVSGASNAQGGSSTGGKTSGGGAGGSKPSASGGVPASGGAKPSGGSSSVVQGGSPSAAGGSAGEGPGGSSSEPSGGRLTGGASSSGGSSGGANTGGRSSGGAASAGGRSGGASSTAGGAPSGGTAGAVASGGASSGGTAAGGASSTYPPELIDDMENVSHFILLNDGRDGQWFPWADAAAGATVEPPVTPIMTSLPAGETGAAPASLHAFRFELFGGKANSLGALMGVELIQSKEGGQRKFPYNAGKYRGIHFWARAEGEAATVLMRLPLRDTLLSAGGACDNSAGKLCDDHYSREVEFATSWAEYSFEWADFTQGQWGLQVKPFDASQLVEIQFMVPSGVSATLWVDDMSFLTK